MAYKTNDRSWRFDTHTGSKNYQDVDIMTEDRRYFESDDQTIGYRFEGYRDFAIHYEYANDILNLQPSSVLDIGGARGYTAKKVLNGGVKRVVVMDKSDHCYNTRAVPEFVIWDIEHTPYPFKNKEFDLIYSSAVMEHISQEKLPDVIKEIGRISNRSLHNTVPTSDVIDFKTFSEDSDHKIFQPRSWWMNMFKRYAPGHIAMINWRTPDKNICVSYKTNLLKLNIGCGYDMIYDGWINVESDRLPEKFAIDHGYILLNHNFIGKLPYKNNTVDIIFIPYLFGSVLSYPNSVELMKECFRVLKIGGVVRICVIDAQKIFNHYINHTDAGLHNVLKGSISPIVSIQDITKLFKGNDCLWDYRNLLQFFVDCRFKQIYLKNAFESVHDVLRKETIVRYPEISLVMEGIKTWHD